MSILDSSCAALLVWHETMLCVKSSSPMPQSPGGIASQQVCVQGCMGQPSPQAHLEPVTAPMRDLLAVRGSAKLNSTLHFWLRGTHRNCILLKYIPVRQRMYFSIKKLHATGET